MKGVFYFFFAFQLFSLSSSAESLIHEAGDALQPLNSWEIVGPPAPENINDLKSDVYSQIRQSLLSLTEDQNFKWILDLEKDSPRSQNPLGDLCTNFRSLSKDEKLEVWTRFLISMGLSESSFDRKATDSRDKHRPYGFWQISLNAKNHPPKLKHCDFSGKVELIRSDMMRNVSCIFSFLELRHKNNLPIYGDPNSESDKFDEFWDSQKKEHGKGKVNALHWSVLRKGDKFESKLAPVFAHLTPSCKLSDQLLEKIQKTKLACNHIKYFFEFRKVPGTSKLLGYPEDYESPFSKQCQDK